MVDDPLVGFHNEHLAFVKLLGQGAMGSVYLGQQLGLDRQVAIKVINAPLAANPTYVQRFSREAKALGKVRHRNVIACHDHGWQAGPDGRLLVMVLEYIDGPNLEKLANRQSLPMRRTLDLYAQAAAGLSAAHRAGIVHRDIKPANLMCTKKGIVKVADFGLAKGGDASALTQTGAIVGTPAFMAPEVCAGDEPGASADIYSLACSLWHTITGTAPYRGHMLHVLQQHLHAPPPDLTTIRPELGTIAQLLMRCMNKESPSERPSADNLAALLHEISEHIDRTTITRVAEIDETVAATNAPTHATVTQAGSLTTSSERQQKTAGRNRKKMLLGLSSAIAVAATLTAIGSFSRSSEEPSQPAHLQQHMPQRPQALEVLAHIITTHDLDRLQEAQALMEQIPADPTLPWASERAALNQALNALFRDGALRARLQGQIDAAAARVSQGLLDQAVADAIDADIPDRPGFDQLLAQQETLIQSVEMLRLSIRAEIEVVISQTAEALVLGDPVLADALLTTVEIPDFPGFIDLIRDLALLAGKADALSEALKRNPPAQPTEVVPAVTVEQPITEKLPVNPAQVQPTERAATMPTTTIRVSAPPLRHGQKPLVPLRPTWLSVRDGGGGATPLAATLPPAATTYEIFCHIPRQTEGTHLHILLAGKGEVTLRGGNSAAELTQQRTERALAWRILTLPIPDTFGRTDRPLALESTQQFWVAWAGVGDTQLQPGQVAIYASPLPTQRPIDPAPQNSSSENLLALVVPDKTPWAEANWGEIIFGNRNTVLEVGKASESRDIKTQAQKLFGVNQMVGIILNDSLIGNATTAQIKNLITQSRTQGTECIFILDEVSLSNRKRIAKGMARSSNFFVFDLQLSWLRYQEVFQQRGTASQTYKHNAILTGLLEIKNQRDARQKRVQEGSEDPPSENEAFEPARPPQRPLRRPRGPGR